MHLEERSAVAEESAEEGRNCVLMPQRRNTAMIVTRNAVTKTGTAKGGCLAQALPVLAGLLN